MQPDRTVREVPNSDLAPLLVEALQAGRTVLMTATGGSMTPFIGHGETVEVAPTAHRRVAPGDVALVRLPSGALLLHRVARLRGRSLYLQGDAQRHAVGPIPTSALLGVAVATYRGGRRMALDATAMRSAGLLWMRTAPIRPLLLRAVRAGKALLGLRRAPSP